MAALAELYQALRGDPWRQRFSHDIEQAHETVLSPSATEEQIREVTNTWFAYNQPCLFGKMASRYNLLRYCILTESDLQRPDDHVQGKIQRARQSWTAAGFDAAASGFIILAVAPRLATAEPNAASLALARRLAELYLLEEIEPDRIYCDHIFLEKPGPARRTWRWQVGCNFFAAWADKRWWHDHRIPGGIAFSMNSVGHMVKASGVNAAMVKMDETLSLDSGEEWSATHLESLDKALELAMRTIKSASSAVSGKATKLLPAESSTSLHCPMNLPRDLEGFNYREYFGWYHTDITLPSEYFENHVERPASISGRSLDFTYLFDREGHNPDFITTGEGVPIRAHITERRSRALAEPEELRIEDCPELVNALRASGLRQDDDRGSRS